MKHYIAYEQDISKTQDYDFKNACYTVDLSHKNILISNTDLIKKKIKTKYYRNQY